jgi:hypothetical protein
VIFGPTCPTGTIYTEPFSSDPVADGTLIPLAGTSVYNAASNTFSLNEGNPNTQVWIGARPSWTNYTISVPMRIDTTINGSGQNAGISFRMESTPPDPAPDNSGEMYFVGISSGEVEFGTLTGSWTQISAMNATFVEGTFYTFEISVNGSTINVSVDGTSYVTNVSDSSFAFGSFGLRTWESGATYGAITVTCD